MNRALKTLVLFCALVALGLSGGVALAYYTTLGAGLGLASVGTLSAPTNVALVPSAGAVTVTWDAVTPPDTGTVVEYTVSRWTDGGPVTQICVDTQLLSCTDSGLVANTYYYSVTATWRSWTAMSSSQSTPVTTGAADATRSTLTPVSASITANGTAIQVLTVQAKDASGTNLTSGGADVTITRQSGTGAISVVTDNGNGTYTATVTAPTTTGSGVFVATLGGDPVKSGTGAQTQATVNYVSGAAATIAVSAGANQSANTGAAFLTAFKALVTDSFGNPVSGVTVTFTAPASGASGTFKTASGACTSGGTTNAASCTASTNASGIATASTYTANATAGAYSVTATAPGTTPSPLNFPLGNTTSGVALTLNSTTACAAGSDGISGANFDADQLPTVTVGGAPAVYSGDKTKKNPGGGALAANAAITVPSLSRGTYLVVVQTTTKAAATQLTITSACVADVTLANGSGTAQKLDNGDSATITFGAKLKASTFCSTWADDPASTVTLTTAVEVKDSGGSDYLDVPGTPCSGGTAFHLNRIVVGDYLGGAGGLDPAIFTGSTIAWNPTALTLTLTLGTLSPTGTVKTGVHTASPVYTADPAITDLLDYPLGNSPFTDPSKSGF